MLKSSYVYGSPIMMADASKVHRDGHGLLVIAVYKFLKTIGLLVLGFGALRFVQGDRAVEVAHLVDTLRIDPHNHYVNHLLEKLVNIDAKKLHQFSVGTFLYAALFLTEGIGLALRQRWAEYLTIISTASLIPIEILEIYKGLSILKILLLLGNILIVWYLMYELRKGRKSRG
jgi:uncharacterized membrane protein (DUF2068 family)